MDLVPGHVGHNMTAMSNATVTTTMAMLLSNMTMGPAMNHHNGSVHHPTHMPNVTQSGHHGHHHAADSGTTIGQNPSDHMYHNDSTNNVNHNGTTMGHDHDHSDHMHHNDTVNNGNHTEHSHGTNGTHSTGDHSDHGSETTGDGSTHNQHGSDGGTVGHSGHAVGHLVSVDETFRLQS